jgi:hypothetical protein
MHIQFRRLALVTVFSIGAGICAAPALAQDDRQEHQQRAEQRDYSNNNYYRIGNREGYQDHGRNVQRTKHNHKFRNDEDRQAHDYGYQQGWQGTDYRTSHRDRDPR